jgi:hypothetical protein
MNLKLIKKWMKAVTVNWGVLLWHLSGDAVGHHKMTLVTIRGLWAGFSISWAKTTTQTFSYIHLKHKTLNKQSHFLSLFYKCVAINTDNGFSWTKMQLTAQEDSSGFVPTLIANKAFPMLIKIVSPGIRRIIFLWSSVFDTIVG